MKIDEWIIREVIDTLNQANMTLLGITGIDFQKRFQRNSRRMRQQSTEGLRVPLTYWNHQ